MTAISSVKRKHDEELQQPTFKKPRPLDLSASAMFEEEEPPFDPPATLSEDLNYQKIFSTSNNTRRSFAIQQYLKKHRLLLGDFKGSGSTSHVFELLSSDHSEPEAIKILKTEKLKNERATPHNNSSKGDRLSQTLSHPKLLSPKRILTFHDGTVSSSFGTGEIVGTIMPLHSGMNLEELLEKRPLTFSEIAKIGLQLTEVLEYIHEKGVIHRDLKLGNVLVDENLMIGLGDFSLAKLIREPRSSSPVGTREYHAPELRHSFLPVYTPKTDAYALGVILSKMIHFQRRVIPEEFSWLVDNLLKGDPLTRFSIYSAKKVLRILQEIR